MMQKVDYTIDNAVIEDASMIALLEIESFSTPWSENQIKEEILKNNCIFLTAKYDNKVLGYISGQIILDEFYISNIAVKEDYRKNGIAYSLLTELLSRLCAGNCIFATLEVRQSNIAAQKLYEKCGFECLGIRKGFYTKPSENALIYTYYFN